MSLAFLIQSDNRCLLIGIFVAFNEFINTVGFMSTIWVFVFYLNHLFILSHFPFPASLYYNSI